MLFLLLCVLFFSKCFQYMFSVELRNNVQTICMGLEYCFTFGRERPTQLFRGQATELSVDFVA